MSASHSLLKSFSEIITPSSFVPTMHVLKCSIKNSVPLSSRAKYLSWYPFLGTFFPSSIIFFKKKVSCKAYALKFLILIIVSISFGKMSYSNAELNCCIVSLSVGVNTLRERNFFIVSMRSGESSSLKQPALIRIIILAVPIILVSTIRLQKSSNEL